MSGDPIEYIREFIDPNWKTILNNPYTQVQGVTPEFPAYPSGHSGFGSSGSLILTNIFGDNRPFTDNCHQDRYEFLGTPRTFTSLLKLVWKMHTAESGWVFTTGWTVMKV